VTVVSGAVHKRPSQLSITNDLFTRINSWRDNNITCIIWKGDDLRMGSFARDSVIASSNYIADTRIDALLLSPALGEMIMLEQFATVFDHGTGLRVHLSGLRPPWLDNCTISLGCAWRKDRPINIDRVEGNYTDV
jgi:hypothetical protein